MEFFRKIDVSTDQQGIINTGQFKNLDRLSSQLFLLETLNEHQAAIGSLWGEFTLTRQEIKGGLRFSLLECPNALTWTITTGYEPAPDSVMVHLTINRTEKDQEFLEEIKDFVDDHGKHLKQAFDSKSNAAATNVDY